jgi:hypothetical protein
MTLASSLIKRYFTTAETTIGLAQRGVEVADEGYQRATPRWDVSNTDARTVVSFGPFRRAVDFNAVLIIEGGEVVEELDIGRTALPAGTAWDQVVVVSLDG